MSTLPRVFRLSTSSGDINIEIFPEQAPETCRNFVAYAQSGRLDGSSFFRVLGPANQRTSACPVDVVQGGLRYDPAQGYEPARGLGPIAHESTAASGIRHRDGVLTMGRFAPGETYGGFGVCIGEQPELDHGGRRFPDRQGAAAFGQVRAGMALIRRIHAAATEDEFVADPVTINRVTAIPGESPMSSDDTILSEDQAIELIAYILASADGLLTEPSHYSPLRMVSVADRLAGMWAPRASVELRAFLDDLHARMPVESAATQAGGDPAAFRAYLAAKIRELAVIVRDRPASETHG